MQEGNSKWCPRFIIYFNFYSFFKKNFLLWIKLSFWIWIKNKPTYKRKQFLTKIKDDGLWSIFFISLSFKLRMKKVFTSLQKFTEIYYFDRFWPGRWNSARGEIFLWFNWLIVYKMHGEIFFFQNLSWDAIFLWNTTLTDIENKYFFLDCDTSNKGMKSSEINYLAS